MIGEGAMSKKALGEKGLGTFRDLLQEAGVVGKKDRRKDRDQDRIEVEVDGVPVDKETDVELWEYFTKVEGSDE